MNWRKLLPFAALSCTLLTALAWATHQTTSQAPDVMRGDALVVADDADRIRGFLSENFLTIGDRGYHINLGRATQGWASLDFFNGRGERLLWLGTALHRPGLVLRDARGNDRVIADTEEQARSILLLRGRTFPERSIATYVLSDGPATLRVWQTDPRRVLALTRNDLGEPSLQLFGTGDQPLQKLP